MVQGRRLSEVAVRHFHEQFNNGQYADIWEQGEDEFRNMGQPELIEFLSAVHRKLGNSRSESLSNINVTVNTNGTFIVTQYFSNFEQGSAMETFTWKKHGQQLKLYGYNINSKALILN